jgi:hypothetical protein
MLRQAKLIDNTTAKSSSSSSNSGNTGTAPGGSCPITNSNAFVVIDLLFHIPSFAIVLAVADPLEIIGTQSERNAFLELKNIFIALLNGSSSDNVNIQLFLDKLSDCTSVEYGKSDHFTDIYTIWDDIVKLIMVVIPPLRELFLGQVTSAQEVPGWLNLMSRCFRAQFIGNNTSLEDICKASLNYTSSIGQNNDNPKTSIESPIERLNSSNSMVLKRAPEILVISIESGHLSNPEILDSLPRDIKPPTSIKFPESFDLTYVNSSQSKNISPSKEFSINTTDDNSTGDQISRIYDLSSIAALEGPNLDLLQAYFRLSGDDSNQDRWFRGAGNISEAVTKTRVVEGNFYGSENDNNVHPRLLIYTRRDLPIVLERTIQLVSKAGQLRALGDVAFALAMTTENYGEARRCYEEAIALDESLRPILQENLNSLEKIERTQKARVLEEQADLALANKRFRDCSDMYSRAMMNAIVNSGVYLRVREKLENVTRIIILDTVCHVAEKGEDALKSSSYAVAKEFFSSAYKSNPEILHLHNILTGIDKTVQIHLATHKITDANAAIKVGKYRNANQLFRDAIQLVPEKIQTLQPTLDNLGPLMKGEDASIRHKGGLAALEEKKFTTAITLITEALTLLPPETPTDYALFLCDRSLAHYEMKEFNNAKNDCIEALKLKSDLAIAHFRLGISQFGLDLFDEASSSYEKALKNDSSLSESVKIKVRQVSSAKEVQERKQREAERSRIKEEQLKLKEEQRIQNEINKKEREEKMAIEKAEKIERNRIKDEEKKANAAKEKAAKVEAKKDKDVVKEKERLEKSERDAAKALERERVRAEKEKARERVKQEKERKLQVERQLVEAGLLRQKEFAAEMERAELKIKESEKEKEAEKERARLERERVVAEREKNRKEKMLALESSKISAKKQEKNDATTKDLSISTKKSSEDVKSLNSTQTPVAAPAWQSSNQSKVTLPAAVISPPKAPLPDFPTLAETLSVSPRKVAAPVSSQNQQSAPISILQPSILHQQQQQIEIQKQHQQHNLYQSNDSSHSRNISDDNNIVSNINDSKQNYPWSTTSESKISSHFQTDNKLNLSKNDSSNSLNKLNLNDSNSFNYPDVFIPSDDFEYKPSAEVLQVATQLQSDAAKLKAANDVAVSSIHNQNSCTSLSSSSSLLSSNSFESSILKSASGDKLDLNNEMFPSYLNFSSSTNSSSVLPSTTPPSISSLLESNDTVNLDNNLNSLGSFGGLGLQNNSFNNYGNNVNFNSSSLLNSTAALGGNNPLKSSSDDFSDFNNFNDSFSLNSLGLNDSILGGLGSSDNLKGLSSGLGNGAGVGLGNGLGLGLGLGLGNGLGSSLGGLVSSSKGIGLGNADLNKNQTSAFDNSSSFLISSSNPFNNPTSSTTSASLLSTDQNSSQSNSSFSSLKFMQDISNMNDESQKSATNQQKSTLNESQHNQYSPSLSSQKLTNNNNNTNSLDFMLGNMTPLPPTVASENINNSQIGIGLGLGGLTSSNLNSSNNLLSTGISSSVPLNQQLNQPPSSFPNNMSNLTSTLSSKNNSNNAEQSKSSQLLYSPSPPVSSQPISNKSSRGMDDDVLGEQSFTSVSWLRQYGMHMYRWSGNSSEWTEYAMHIPLKFINIVCGDNNTNLHEISMKSGCKLWIDSELLNSQSATFLVLQRGPSGSASNQYMNVALEIISNTMRQYLLSINNDIKSNSSSSSDQSTTSWATTVNPPGLCPSNLPSTPPLSSLTLNNLSTNSSYNGSMNSIISSLTAGLAGSNTSLDEIHSDSDYYDYSTLEGDWSDVPRRLKTIRPEPLKVTPMAGGYVHRTLEIPRDAVGMIIGQGGKKIKDLCVNSGAKVQFRVNKTAEREGRSAVLEVQGSLENVDAGLQLIWDLLQMVGKDYTEVSLSKR